GTTAKATPHRQEQDVGVFTGEDVTTDLNKSVLAFTFHPTSSRMEMQQQLMLTWKHLSKICSLCHHTLSLERQFSEAGPSPH
ncbi:Muscle, Skeletal Receptor Tyrosine-Protein Kinase, partial [Manis pentadactyla]